MLMPLAPPHLLTRLEIGQTLQATGPRLDQEAFDDFGALHGTDAPIHVDPEYARNTSFGGTIAQGMLLVAPLEAWLCDLFGNEGWFRGGALKVKLLRPASAGDCPVMTLTVKQLEADGATFAFLIGPESRPNAVGEVRIRG